MAQKKVPVNPNEYEITLTSGVGVTNTRDIRNVTIKAFDLKQYLQSITVHISKLHPTIRTHAEWFGELSKRDRDTIKIKAPWTSPGKLLANTRRASANVEYVPLAILDLDEGDLSHLEVAQLLGDTFGCYYQTANSKPKARRWRVVIPLCPSLPPAVYGVAVKKWLKGKGITADACSGVAAQCQMAPISFDDYPASIYETFGDLLDLSRYAGETVAVLPDRGVTVDGDATVVSGNDDDDDSRGQTVRVPVDPEAYLLHHREPMRDLDDDDVRAILDKHDADCSYDKWLRIGMAIHHQYQGNHAGWVIWDEWSQNSANLYPGAQQTHAKYKSFASKTQQSPVTLGMFVGTDELSVMRLRKARTKLAREIKGCADLDVLNNEMPAKIQGSTSIRDSDKTVLLGVLQEQIKRVSKAELGSTATPSKRDLAAAGNVRAIAEKGDADLTFLQDWVYDQSIDKYRHKYTLRTASQSGFRQEYASRCRLAGKSIDPVVLGRTGKSPIPTVAGTRYMPGSPMLFVLSHGSGEGSQFLNLWRAESEPQNWCPLVWSDEDTQMARNIIRLFVLLFPNRRERRLLMAWLVWIVQNPGKHPMWATCIAGAPGAGKTTLSLLMYAALGPENVGVVDPRLFETNFNDWAMGHRLKVIEEIDLPFERKSRAIVNHIKPMITNDTLAINAKNMALQQMPNVSAYLAFSNTLTGAIPLDSDDRRWFILLTRQRNRYDVADMMSRHPQLFTLIRKAVEKHPRLVRGMAMWLKPEEISDEFDAYRPAPMTQAKREWMQTALPADEQALEAVLASGEAVPGIDLQRGVLALSHLKETLERDHGISLYPTRIARLLRGAGWSKYGRNQAGRLWLTAADGTRYGPVIWLRDEDWQGRIPNASQLERIYKGSLHRDRDPFASAPDHELPPQHRELRQLQRDAGDMGLHVDIAAVKAALSGTADSLGVSLSEGILSVSALRDLLQTRYGLDMAVGKRFTWALENCGWFRVNLRSRGRVSVPLLGGRCVVFARREEWHRWEHGRGDPDATESTIREVLNKTVPRPNPEELLTSYDDDPMFD